MNDETTQKSSNASSGDDQNQSPTQQNSTENGDIIALKQELEASQQKLKEMTNITQHALADLQNFRRRAEEERASYVTYANADLLSQLIPVLENMNKALAHEPKDSEWIKGAEATMKQFQNALQNLGLKAIEAKDQPFDPKIHEALMVGPGPKDQIIEEYEKGYMLGDKVLKRSRVRVGNGENSGV